MFAYFRTLILWKYWRIKYESTSLWWEVITVLERENLTLSGANNLCVCVNFLSRLSFSWLLSFPSFFFLLFIIASRENKEHLGCYATSDI